MATRRKRFFEPEACELCGGEFRHGRRYTAYTTPVLGNAPAKELDVCRDCMLMLAEDDEDDEEEA